MQLGSSGMPLGALSHADYPMADSMLVMDPPRHTRLRALHAWRTPAQRMRPGCVVTQPNSWLWRDRAKPVGARQEPASLRGQHR